jgi:hypothetical protein
MTSTTSRNERKGELLKVDARGRVQVSEERREALLDEFDRSGMSGAGFAKHYGIKYTTFAYWIQARRRKRNPSTPSGENQFLMVSVEAASRAKGLTVELSLGVTLKITTPEEARLAAVLIESLRPSR